MSRRRRETVIDESLPPAERLFRAIQGDYTDEERAEVYARYDAAVERRQTRVTEAFEARIRERWRGRWNEEDWSTWSHRDATSGDRAGRFWRLVEMRGRTWAQRQLDTVPPGQDPLIALEAAHERTKPIEFWDADELAGL